MVAEFSVLLWDATVSLDEFFLEFEYKVDQIEVLTDREWRDAFTRDVSPDDEFECLFARVGKWNLVVRRDTNIGFLSHSNRRDLDGFEWKKLAGELYVDFQIAGKLREQIVSVGNRDQIKQILGADVYEQIYL